MVIVGVLLVLVTTGLTQKTEDKKSSDAKEERFQDEVSYSHDIQPIVKNFCTTCHAGDDPEGEFVLTSYADVRKYTEKGKLLKRINVMAGQARSMSTCGAGSLRFPS